MCLFYLFYT